MQEFNYHDQDSLQAVLEGIAVKTNRGACQSYNYCKFCAEPQSIVRESSTPCADAFIRSGANYVYCPNWCGEERKENYRKIIKYKPIEEN